MARSRTPVLQRIIARLGRAKTRQLFFDLERLGNKSKVANMYGLSPSYLTELCKDVPSVTTYQLPPDLLDEDLGEGGHTPFTGAHMRQVVLDMNNVTPTSPETMAAYLKQLGPAEQAKMILDPSLRAAAYWAAKDSL